MARQRYGDPGLIVSRPPGQLKPYNCLCGCNRYRQHGSVSFLVLILIVLVEIRKKYLRSAKAFGCFVCVWLCFVYTMSGKQNLVDDNDLAASSVDNEWLGRCFLNTCRSGVGWGPGNGSVFRISLWGSFRRNACDLSSLSFLASP